MLPGVTVVVHRNAQSSQAFGHSKIVRAFSHALRRYCSAGCDGRFSNFGSFKTLFGAIPCRAPVLSPARIRCAHGARQTKLPASSVLP